MKRILKDLPMLTEDLEGVRDENTSLALNLTNRIRLDILAGTIRSGSKLTEQSICDQYNISRTPVRESLVRLEIDGLIHIIPNRGAYVIGLDDADLKDFFQLRKINEVQATQWAAVRITADEIDQLEENFEFMEFYTMKKDVKKMLNINKNFHKIIAGASHNRVLIRSLSSYRSYIQSPSIPPDEVNSYLDTVLDEHRDIFLAFLERNPQAAAHAMTCHLDNGYRRYLSYLQDA